MLLKYFLVQGIASGHHVLLSTAGEKEPKNFMMGLPWLVNETDGSDVDDNTTELEEKMTIAWRYKGLKKFESSIKDKPNLQNKQIPSSETKPHQIEKPFCSTFDLTKSIPQNILDNAQMTLVNVNELSNELKIGIDNPYNTLLDKIRKVIEENHFSSLLVPPSNIERNALRIGIHSIASPSWQSKSSHVSYYINKYTRGLRLC